MSIPVSGGGRLVLLECGHLMVQPAKQTGFARPCFCMYKRVA